MYVNCVLFDVQSSVKNYPKSTRVMKKMHILRNTRVTSTLSVLWYKFILKSCHFKVLCNLQSEKFESLFYKINTSLQKTITSIGLQAEQILSVNI